MRGLAIRFLQSAVDRLLGVDSQRVLNGKAGSKVVSDDIAAKMRTIVDQLKMEGFDTERGLVDYEKLENSGTYQKYKRVTSNLWGFDPSTLESRAERLAFWINLYNSLIVDAVIALGIKQSVWETGKGFFRQVAYQIGGLRYSADDIEHGILRGNRRHPAIPLSQFVPGDPRLENTIIPIEPRVHFALVCASLSCPFVTVYHASDIEEELEIAASSFINGSGVTISQKEKKVHLSRIFKWFEADFGGKQGVIEFILRYLKEGPEKDFWRSNIGKVYIKYQRYNWSLNHI